MKSLASFKICVTLVGLAAGLVFSPACKAQSEIAPDHFDGTDCWEAAAHRKATQSKSPLKRLAAKTNHSKLTAPFAFQLTDKPQIGQSHSGPAIPNQHKVVAQNLRKTTVMQ
jgi:hypothetical protein